jgi:hypothetical protein
MAEIVGISIIKEAVYLEWSIKDSNTSSKNGSPEIIFELVHMPG